MASNLTNLDVSQDTFEEIANGLEAQGVQINPESPITLTKNIKIKGPINYRQVSIRRDVLSEAVKIYKTPVDQREMEVSDSKHFIKFLDDVYNYVLSGKKPETTEAEAKPKTNNGWNN